MANRIPETLEELPDSPWDCEIDGHEWEEQGEYDPETNCYPFMECIYCGETGPWDSYARRHCDD